MSGVFAQIGNRTENYAQRRRVCGKPWEIQNDPNPGAGPPKCSPHRQAAILILAFIVFRNRSDICVKSYVVPRPIELSQSVLAAGAHSLSATVRAFSFSPPSKYL